jgi:hypothetical protein
VRGHRASLGSRTPGRHPRIRGWRRRRVVRLAQVGETPGAALGWQPARAGPVPVLGGTQQSWVTRRQGQAEAGVSPVRLRAPVWSIPEKHPPVLHRLGNVTRERSRARELQERTPQSLSLSSESVISPAK